MEVQGLTQRPCARDVYQRLEARALVLDAGAVARIACFLAQLLRDAGQHDRRPRLAHQERDQCEQDQRESAYVLALVSHAVGGPRRGCEYENAPTRGTRTTLLRRTGGRGMGGRRGTYIRCSHWIQRQPMCLFMSTHPATTAPRPVQPTAASEKIAMGRPRLIHR